MLLRPLSILLSFSFILGTASRKYVEKEIDGLIEGDIQLTDDEGSRVKRQILTVVGKWPNGVVNYSFDNGINETSRLIIRTAMNYISARTCVTFVEDSPATNRIKFLNDDCSSPVGMKGGEQFLRLGDKCVTFGMAVHQIMHTLGIIHTNQRTDRDDYVTVNYKNVPEWLWEDNLNINDTANNVTPFEYGSVMMLPGNVYGPGTITSKQSDYTNTLGFRRVTFYDMMMLNSHYSCSCAVDLACKNGGRTNPAKCSECLCPAGYAGTLCDQPPPGTEMYYTDTAWKGNFSVFGNLDSDLPIGEPRMTYIWITAPAGKAIQYRVFDLDGCTCEPGCNSNGVEPRSYADPAIVNPIFCCNDDKTMIDKIYLSYQNPTPVVMHERSGECNLFIYFRHVDAPPTTPSTTTSTTTTTTPTPTPTPTPTTTPIPTQTPTPTPTRAPVTTTKPKDCHNTATQTTTCKCTTTHTKMYETEECRIAAGGQCSSTTTTGGRKTVTKCSSDTTNI
ncbi:hypothetical protein CRE_11192 [Caenorhabditis remanei]|uniref:Zinc metalloproteinase n=1 Tax=Caenorhabditis remanei TaxID=31234 RepID=E3MQA0_CAERE|nr:hypothetical protein CRE_11192 [Caenorhabditis remanei]